MAFGSLEIASIPRTQDYSVMKQNEDKNGKLYGTFIKMVDPQIG
jgi:hypothetical protein